MAERLEVDPDQLRPERVGQVVEALAVGEVRVARFLADRLVARTTHPSSGSPSATASFTARVIWSGPSGGPPTNPLMKLNRIGKENRVHCPECNAPDHGRISSRCSTQ